MIAGKKVLTWMLLPAICRMDELVCEDGTSRGTSEPHMQEECSDTARDGDALLRHPVGAEARQVQ